MPGLRRREFITLLGGAAASWPMVARTESITVGYPGWPSCLPQRPTARAV